MIQKLTVMKMEKVTSSIVKRRYFPKNVVKMRYFPKQKQKMAKRRLFHEKDGEGEVFS